MTIITKGMGVVKFLKAIKKRKKLSISFPKSIKVPPRKGTVIIKKPSKTKLADTWQGRRIDAMNRKIKRRKAGTDRYIDEHGAIIASKAPTKKVYKSVQKKFHGLTSDQQSEIYMKKAKRDPKSFHFDKKKFGKK